MIAQFAWILFALTLATGKSAAMPTADFFKFENENTNEMEDVGWKNKGSEKIVGGTPADEGRYPYMAILVTNESQLACGGTHISPSFVLSAAQCAGMATKVNIGRYLLDDPSGSLMVGIENEIIYKEFDKSTLNGDFMLVRLQERVTSGTFPHLSKKNFSTNFTNQTVLTTIGWGHTSVNGSFSNTLLEVDVKYIPRRTCSNQFPINEQKITNLMICAGGVEGKDSCQGDGGGPLLAKKASPEEDIILGITSWGIGCASGYPGVYAHVGKVETWIKEELSRIGESVIFHEV